MKTSLPENTPFMIEKLDAYLANLKGQVFYQDMEIEEIVEDSMFNHRAFRFLLLSILSKPELLHIVSNRNKILGTRIQNTFNYFFVNNKVGNSQYKEQIKHHLKWCIDKSFDMSNFIHANKGIRKDVLDFWKDLTVYRLHCWKECNF